MPSTSSPSERHYAGPRPNSEMTQDFNLWKHQVRQAITGLCAFNSGAEAAGGQDCPGFRQALATLYGEVHFAEFMAFQGWRQAGLTEATGQALQALQAQLDAYDEPDTDAAILVDPVWWAILEQAGHVVSLLREDNGSLSG